MSVLSEKSHFDLNQASPVSAIFQPGLDTVKRLFSFFTVTDEERKQAGIVSVTERYDDLREIPIISNDSDRPREGGLQ